MQSFRKLFKFAALNLLRNKRRSVSTGLAICVGFVGLNLLGAYIYRVKKALDATSVYSSLRGHVQIYKKDSLVKFAQKPKLYIFNKIELEEIKKVLQNQLSDIEYTGYNLSGSGLLSNGVRSHPVVALSYEPEVYAKSLSQPELLKWAKDWVLPSQVENIDIFNVNDQVISITPKIADIMGFSRPLKSSGSAQLAARTFDGDLNAVNVDLAAEHTTGLQYLEDTIILVPLVKMQELLGTDSVESVALYLNQNINLKKFKQNLDKELERVSFKTESFFYYDEKINSMYIGTLSFLIVMSGFFVFLIGTAVSLTIINSLTMGIIERTKEIGTLRAVGFRQKDVASLFISESMLLCLISLVVGTIFAFAIASVINYLNIQFTPPAISGKVQFKLGWNLQIAFTVSVLISILTFVSSFFVMRSKSKMKLIELLNDTGA